MWDSQMDVLDANWYVCEGNALEIRFYQVAYIYDFV